jgi:polyphosphate glucokinase
MTIAIGVDVGGTGIKGAPVDVTTGRLLAPKRSVATPRPATPEAIAAAVGGLVGELGAEADWPVGVAFPAVVRDGVVKTAANIDPAWVGTDGAALFGGVLGRPATLLNDADAAGLAEVEFGAGRGRVGTIAVVTLGTGIGSALFTGGRLFRNTELGRLLLGETDACFWACAVAKEREGLGWPEWTARLQRYLSYLEWLIWPDLVILGGAISEAADEFIPRLELEAEIMPAQLGADAGIVGAALAA